MLNRTMEGALNEQIRQELASAYVYLAMSAYADAQNYPGMAHWLRLQSKEELGHAMAFFGFITDRGGRVILGPLEQPPSEYPSPIAVFEEVVRHEQRITGLIHDLYALALQERDYASLPILQTFLSEQVEEERSAEEILARVRIAGNECRMLLLVDRELAARQ